MTTSRAWLYVNLHWGIATGLQTSGCCDDELAAIAQPANEGTFEALFLLGLPMEDSHCLFCCRGCMAVHFGKEKGTNIQPWFSVKPTQ